MSAQPSGKGRKTKTTVVSDVLSLMNYNDMTDKDFESVLEEVTHRGNSKSSKTSVATPVGKALVSQLLEEKTKEIDEEEKKFGGSLMQSTGMKHHHGLSSSLKTSSLLADHSRSRENESMFEENHRIPRPQIQQCLGSAGSSKASSNASDESEEMDTGMISNYDSIHDFCVGPSLVFMECPNQSPNEEYSDFKRNYHHDMHAKEDGQTSQEGGRGGRCHQFTSNSRNSGERSKVSNRGYDEEYREREYQGSTRMSFSHNPQLSSRHNNNRGGSQSDPQHYQQLNGSFAHENDSKYLEKKKGRSEKLKKLSKYQSKKPDMPVSSQDSTAYEKVYNAALSKNGSLDGIALLDYLSAEKQKLEKTEASKKLLHIASSPAETSPGSRSKKKSSPDIPSKSYSSMSAKHGVVRGEGSNQKARKAKVSDTESSHGSDQEIEVDANLRSTRLPAFPKHSRSLKLDASPETPVSYSITQQAGWENDIEAMERDNFRYCSPATNGEQASSGRSSHSSDDIVELRVGTYIRLNDVEADADDADKQEAAVVGKVDKQKKKKKKSKKKKTSPEQSKELPRIAPSLPASPSAPIAVVVPSSPPSSIPVEEVAVPRPNTPVMAVHLEQTRSNEQPSETEFQVVTRRVSAKTSPTKSHSTPHNYPAPNRQNNVRNRMSQPPPRISKQPAVAVVPVAALEFPTLRRRNSAGDIKKGVADHVEDTDTGDLSDAETVASMPALNKKKGSKTTSAPATRLPTPGISYADIAKGTQNGGSHNNSLSDTHAMDSSPEKSLPKDGSSDPAKKNRSEKPDVHESRETQTVPVLVEEVQDVQVEAAQAVTATEAVPKPEDGPTGYIRPTSDPRNQQQHQQQPFRPKNFRDFPPRGPLPSLHNGPLPLLNRPPPRMMHQSHNSNHMQQPRHLVSRQSFNNGRPMDHPQNFNRPSPHHQGINLPPPRFNQPPIPFQYSQGRSAPAHFLAGPVMHQLRGVSSPAQPFLDPRTGQPVPHPHVFQVQQQPPPPPEPARMYQVPPPGYNGQIWPNGPPMPVQMIGANRQEPPPPHTYAYPPNGLMYRSAQSFYPDIGCSHNVSTHHTHMELMRRMKPAPPLAHFPGPGIYPRSRVNVPPPPPPPAPEEDNQWIGKKSMIFRNSQQPIFVEPEMKLGEQVSQARQPVSDVQEVEKAQEAPKMVASTAAEIYAFMKDRFEAARQKCIDGVPGCSYYRP